MNTNLPIHAAAPRFNQIPACARLAAALLLVLAPAQSFAADTTITALDSFTFDQPDVTINVGDTVTWIDLQASFHNVAQTDAPADNAWNGVGFYSGNAGSVDTFEHTFDTAGTFFYTCEPHAGLGMKGSITVEEAGPSVVASNFMFTDADITINVGDTVSWTGLQDGSHNVAQSTDASADVYDGTGFRSGNPGEFPSFEQTFNTPGTFFYVCEPHAAAFGMKGSITVLGDETLGDPNGDGLINSTDALWIIQSEFGLRQGLTIATSDLNDDGLINSTDALWVIQIEFGLREAPTSSFSIVGTWQLNTIGTEIFNGDTTPNLQESIFAEFHADGTMEIPECQNVDPLIFDYVQNGNDVTVAGIINRTDTCDNDLSEVGVIDLELTLTSSTTLTGTIFVETSGEEDDFTPYTYEYDGTVSGTATS